LPQVDNRCEVVVLQHPRERLHPIGTARLARLGLRNAQVHIAWNAGEFEDEPPSWVDADLGLLYPAGDARELDALPREQHPRRLLVLDGTWHTAKTLYRQKRWLHALPHYRLSPDEPGRYRIRREPQRDYLSTIEAIVCALKLLEPDTAGLDELLRAFDAMIDTQLALSLEHAGDERRTRKRRRASHQRRVPHALVEDFSRLVLIYGEAARGSLGETREFAYFVAYAVATGARFECFIRSSYGPPTDAQLGHMRLSREQFSDACSSEVFSARWADFLATCRAPLLAAWNQRTLELLALATGTPSGGVSIKGAYRARHGVEAHSLADVLAAQQLTPSDAGGHGRAAERLASTVAVTRFLHDAAVPDAQAQPT
jgi:DTW domain-containing protein YfiP